MQGLVKKLSDLLREKKWMMAAAESCTGGLLSAALTHRPGSSEIFDRAFIIYSNEAKTDILKVPKPLIEANGAVSAECAESMARGCLNNSRANICISITGIAGPDGGTDEKPVGLVYIGYALKSGATGSAKHQFEGGREQVRALSTAESLKKAIEVIEKEK